MSMQSAARPVSSVLTSVHALLSRPVMAPVKTYTSVVFGGKSPVLVGGEYVFPGERLTFEDERPLDPIDVVASVRRSFTDMPVFSDGPSPEEVAAICAMIAKRPHSATVREWAQALAARIADAND